MLSILVTERENFNHLELDEEFIHTFLQMNNFDPKEMDDFVYLCDARMKIRLKLSQLIIIVQRTYTAKELEFDIS